MKKIIKVCAVVFIAFLFSLSAAGCYDMVEIDLSSYSEMIFDGVNGEGTAIHQFNYGKLENDIASMIAKNPGASNHADNASRVIVFEESLSFNITQSEGLSNGDRVTVTINFDKEKAKNAGITSVGSVSRTFTVYGLSDKVELNPFDSSFFEQKDGVEIKLTGLSGRADMEIKNHFQEDEKDDPRKFIAYTADKTEGIKNGDQIKITASLKTSAPKNYILKEDQRIITIERLHTIVTDMNQIKYEKDKEELDNKIKEAFKKQSDIGFVFHTDKGQQERVGKNSDGNKKVKFSRMELQDNEYRVEPAFSKEEGDILSIFRFTVEVKADWFYSLFHTSQTADYYEHANGYIIVKNLVLDDEKKLVKEPPVEVKIYEHLFETETQAELNITEQCGAIQIMEKEKK